MIYITFFCSITLFIFFILNMRNQRNLRVYQRLSLLKIKERSNENAGERKNKIFYLVFKRIHVLWKEFKRSFRNRMPGEKQVKLELKLLRAGNPFGMTPVEFRLLQITSTILAPLLLGGYAILANFNLGVIVLLSIIGFCSGGGLPYFYIKQKTKEREKKALRELPDILDLLTVSLEAGLGFDGALNRVIAKKQGVLSTEFHRCLEEIRLGKSRRQALKGVKDRLTVDEIKVLISSILQAEKLGIGMVQVLRIQSSEVREQRRQRAEEEAMKAPIKMLFPLVLFIFPSLFIVLLGPAIIEFMTTFNK